MSAIQGRDSHHTQTYEESKVRENMTKKKRKRMMREKKKAMKRKQMMKVVQID